MRSWRDCIGLIESQLFIEIIVESEFASIPLWQLLVHDSVVQYDRKAV